MSTNPYPGLRSFEYTESHLFFGREGQAKEVANRLEKSHFVAVVGTSGSGKSSLVRAGLLPLLYSGRRFETSANWRISLMRPGETPIRNLAQALVEPEDFGISEMFGGKDNSQQNNESLIGITEAILRRSGVGLLDFVKTSDFHKNENLLIVVDQFEELFRFKRESRLEDSDDAIAFVKLLLEATNNHDSGIYVVITMRSDFLGDCAEFRDLPEAINNGQYLIPRMTREQQRLSIESPAKVYDAEVSPALVNQLLNELENNQKQILDVRDRMLQDHLPVLQHALMRTWDIWEKQNPPTKENKDIIDIRHYEDPSIGGMAFALSNHADEAFAELNEREQFIAEKMFKCLTETDNESRQIRRPAKIEEICAVAGAEEEEVFKVIEVFRRAGRTFLMPPVTIPLASETMIDISHESLIRNWKKLTDWVKEEAADARVYRRLAEKTLLLEQYKNANKDRLSAEELEKNCKSFLWRGIELKDALDWRKNFEPGVDWAARYQFLSEEEKAELAALGSVSTPGQQARYRHIIEYRFIEAMTFLDESAANDEIERAEEEEFLRFRVSQRYTKILTWATVGLVFLFLAAVIAAIFAFRQNNLLSAAQDELTAQNAQLMEKQQLIESQNQNLEKAKEELENQQKILEKQNKELERYQEDLKKNQSELEKNNDELKNSVENAEEQKMRADQQTALAQKSEKIAKNAQAEAQKLADNAKEENTILNSNLQGSVSIEAKDYQEAEVIFKSLLAKYKPCTDVSDETCKKQTAIKEWWAHHNIGVANSQLIKFKASRDAFNDALKDLDTFEGKDPKEYVRVQSSPTNYFTNIAYRPLAFDSDREIAKSRIITLRKYAQFYRKFAVNPDFFKTPDNIHDAQEATALNETALALYKDLIEIKNGVYTKDPNDLDDTLELADTYFALNKPLEAQALYQKVLEANPSDIIPVHEKMIEVLLQQNKPLDAEGHVKAIFEKKRADLMNLPDVSEKELLYKKDIADFYNNLATIYKKYALKTREELFLEIKKLQQNTSDEKEIAKLDTLEYYASYSSDYLSRYESTITPYAEKYPELVRKIKVASDLDKKYTAFSSIATSIKNFNAGEDLRAPNWFERYRTLADAYLRNNDCAYVLQLLSDADTVSGKLYKDNPDKRAALRLYALRNIGLFYEDKLGDYDTASKIYDDWTAFFKENFTDKLDTKEKTRQSLFYYSIGLFYYKQGSYGKARAMLTDYLDYIEKNGLQIESTSERYKNTMLFRPLHLKILIAQTYQKENNPLKATGEYEKLLEDIQKLKVNNKELSEKKVSASVNSNSNTSRVTEKQANVKKPDPSKSDELKDSSSDYFNNSVSIYEAYIRVRLAELYFSQNKNKEALLLLNDRAHLKLENDLDDYVQEIYFIIDGYVSSSRKIANYLRQNPEQSERYYQYAIASFEYMNSAERAIFIDDSPLTNYTTGFRVTKEWYEQYVAILEEFEKFKGESAELKVKIKEAKENRDKASSFKEYTKVKDYSCFAAGKN